MSAQRRRLVLVDGSTYLYRAFHAMPSLTNSKGDPTGAAYGMTNMLKRLEAEVAPELAAVIFDAKGKTFRDDLYPEYKANRAPMPTELRAQIESIHALVRALGFPLLVVGGVEADDVIGTLAELGKKAGLDVLVSTGDKDMAQLVDDNVTMVNTMDGAVLDAAGVEAKFGVRPESIVDYLTLVGDTVDNVPGVPKVGPKTAVKWLAQYRTVEEVVAHAGEIKGKVGENLRASLEQIPLSKDLVTIRRDVPLDVGPLDLELREPDTETLKALYGELEFRTWLGELLGRGGDAPDERRRVYGDVLTKLARRLTSASKPPRRLHSTPRPRASTTCRQTWWGSRSQSSRGTPPMFRSATTTRVRRCSWHASWCWRSCVRSSSPNGRRRSARTSSTT